jgi:hypothetical protein
VAFRRFRSALQLLRAVAAFEGLLSRSLLVGLAVGRLLCQGMMPYIRGAAGGGQSLEFGVAAAEAAVEALPAEWAEAGPLPEAAAFVEHVAWLGRALEQQQAAGGKADAARSRLGDRVAKALARLGDRERARRTAAAFGVAA